MKSELKTIGAASIATALVAGALMPLAISGNSAFAAEEPTITIKVPTVGDSSTPAETGATYDAYKIFTADVTYDAENDKDVASNIQFVNAAVESAFYDALSTVYMEYDEDTSTYIFKDGIPDSVKAYQAIANGDGVSASLKGQMAAEMMKDAIKAEVPNDTSEIQGIKGNSFASVFANKIINQVGYKQDPVAEQKTELQLGQGYFLVVAHDIPIGTGFNATSNTAGTSPMFLLSGGHSYTVNQKKAVPTLTKTVKDDDVVVSEDADENSYYGSSANQTFGEYLDFKLEATMPTDYDAYSTYQMEFVDTPNGLSDLKDISVWVRKANGNTWFLSSTDYPTEGIKAEYKDGVLKVSFDEMKTVTYEGDKGWGIDKIESTDVIIVKYKAKVNANSGTKKNNTAYLTYSNVPGQPEQKGQTVEEMTYISNYAFDIDKVSADAPTTHLAGAKFVVYADDTHYFEFDDSGNIVGKAEITDGEVPGVAILTTPENGVVTVNGVDAGTYKIEEIASPTGYNKLMAPFYITVNAELDTEDDRATVSLNEITNELSGQHITAEGTGSVVTVENTSGIELPITGQQGFMLISLAGGIILAVSLGGTLLRRRNTKEE